MRGEIWFLWFTIAYIHSLTAPDRAAHPQDQRENGTTRERERGPRRAEEIRDFRRSAQRTIRQRSDSPEFNQFGIRRYRVQPQYVGTCTPDTESGCTER